MARCRDCQEPIFWAYEEPTLRWRPCDLESLDGTEEMRQGDRGPYVEYESHHLRHICGLHVRRSEPEFRETKFSATVRSLKNPHATLFLLPNAPIEVVKAAHRALAQLHHPDVGGDSERMAEINAAYDELVGIT